MAVVDADSTIEAIKAEFPNLTPSELQSVGHVIALLDKIANTSGAGAVTIVDGGDVAEGAKADAAVVNPASAASVIALLKGLLTELLLLTAAPSNNSANTVASLIIKASPGTLYSVQGFNNKASAQYIQLHDSATLPADTAVPIGGLSQLVQANSPWSFDFGQRGRAFAAGIVVCNSSTLATKTIGAADCSFDSQFI